MAENNQDDLNPSEADEEQIDELTLEQLRDLGSAEFRAMTYVIDGQPMSWDQMVQYQAERKAQQERDEAALEEIVRLQAEDN